MDFTVKTLGDCQFDSPLKEQYSETSKAFVTDKHRIIYQRILDFNQSETFDPSQSFERAGPRKKIFFNPKKTKIGIVTCGGLCPGLNDVIRSIVMQSHYRYGVDKIIGIRYGYNGLNPANGFYPIELTPKIVKDIHKDGGTILGSSRGGTDNMDILVDTLDQLKINILYTLGGDGTLKGAHNIAQLAKERGMDLSVIGIPKTIDNDISFIDRSFGFETAFSIAANAINAAHVEAEGAPNGIGLVKLMGRHSGFIAANAALAMNDVNFVLVPEVPINMKNFLSHLESRMSERDHSVICVAEGAGQELILHDDNCGKKDKSNNAKIKDIGIFLKKRIKEHFKSKNIDINLKYIDPSYMIRSLPANPNDSLFCELLGQHAVHAGMAGKTDILIGHWNNSYTHVPIELAISKRKFIDIDSMFWHSVIEATGQPVDWCKPF